MECPHAGRQKLRGKAKRLSGDTLEEARPHKGSTYKNKMPSTRSTIVQTPNVQSGERNC